MLRTASVAFAVLAMAAARRDVPDGMCFECEVNCIKDCTAKFHTEVMKDDAFLQKPAEISIPKQIAATYMNRLKTEGKNTCSKDRGCAIGAECAQSVENEMVTLEKQQMQEHDAHEIDQALKINKEHKPWTDVSGREVTINDLPKFHKAVDPHAHPGQVEASSADIARLESSHKTSTKFDGHLRLAQTALAPTGESKRAFPLHPVKMGVFSKGGQTLTQCMKFCFAATCGCQDSPMTGTVKITQKLSKDAIASGYHTDTPPAWRYSKATKKECAGGVGKLIEGLYIIWHAGPNGQTEVCSDEMFKMKAGTSGALGLTDPLEDKKKCDCGINRLDCNEPDFGCSWNPTSARCEFKAIHNTVCYKRYHTDLSLAGVNGTTVL